MVQDAAIDPGRARDTFNEAAVPSTRGDFYRQRRDLFQSPQVRRHDAVDGSVLTSNIDFIQNLNVSSKEIEDLTGIEDFEALLDLNVGGNALKTLDISGNRNLLFLWAENNQLTQLVIGNNPNIEKLGASGNQLTTLKVTEYTTLQLLDLANNEITAIDVSTLPLPTFNEFKIEGNPLICIQVSPEQLQNIPASWTKDEEDTYSPDCE